MLSDSTASASITALHVMMAFLRRHRASSSALTSPFVLPSFAFGVLPWVWATPIGLTAGVIAHLIWFIVCEVASPPSAPRDRAPARSPAPAPRTARSTAPPHASVNSRTPAGPAFAATPVLAVLDEATDIKTLRLARPEGCEFAPGQFVAVRVQIDGKPHVRCYSISSAPHTRGYLEISVRKQGLVSGTLHATVRAGSSLTINRPAGQFVYPGGDDRPIALIAGGIGITPLLSMLRHAVACDPLRPVVLLYSARTEQDVAFHSELRMLAERYPQVRVAITLSAATVATRFRRGRVDAALIRQYVASPAHTVFCLCGPPAMLEAMKTTLTGLRVPEAQIRYEQFDTAAAASLVNPAATLAPAAEGRRPNGKAFQVSFSASGISAFAPATRTLLETAEAEGVAMVSSCRAGVCQACRTRVASGSVDCRSDVLAPEDRDAGFVLPCVSWAASDCELEA